jgi:transcriptional regulator with XRE-family HTH domain
MASHHKTKRLEELGLRIRQFRLRRKMSINQVALEAEISPGNLSEIEKGKRDPRYCTLRALAHSVGITVSALLLDL